MRNKPYGISYRNWKSWRLVDFASLSREDVSIFNSELTELKKHLKPGVEVLEVGFGNGQFLAYAKLQGWNICGTEVNYELVEAAVSKGFNCRYSTNLVEFTPNSFDLVVAFDVLEHMEISVISAFINQVFNVLRPGGFFIARFPNADSPFSNVNQFGDPTHISAIGSGMAHFFAQESGFDVVCIRGSRVPVLSEYGLKFLHRIITLPIKYIIEMFLNLLFSPRKWISYCSTNMTIVFRKKII